MHSYKSICKYKSLAFNADKVKQYEHIRKVFANKYKEEPTLFGSTELLEKPSGFDELSDDDKTEFNKLLVKSVT